MRAAAVVSALRCASGKASCAALSSAADSCRALTVLTLTRSNSAVYSSTGGSPRARTSAMMAATDASIASSCGVSNAMRRASAASKPATEESSRRNSGIAAAPGKGLHDRIEEGLHHFTLEFERRRIDDQPCAYRQDILDRDQIVGLQRVASAHQIDDHVGKSNQWCQFHRAVKLDQVDMDTLGGKMLPCGSHVLGRDFEPCAALHRAGVVEIAPGRHD